MDKLHSFKNVKPVKHGLLGRASGRVLGIVLDRVLGKAIVSPLTCLGMALSLACGFSICLKDHSALPAADAKAQKSKDTAKVDPYSLDLMPVSIAADGMMRDFAVHLPPNLKQQAQAGIQPQSVPLVLVFHDGFKLAQNMDEVTGFNAIADRENFAVVYPMGINGHWNDGRNIDGYAKFDDVSFVKHIIEYMQRRYHIDREHVYACGIGNGGFFSQYLALMLPGHFSAIASVAATLPENIYHSRQSIKPVSVFYILGMNDPLVPFRGGPIHFESYRDRGMVVPAPEAVQFWVKGNRGQSTPNSQDLPDTDPSDGCRVKAAVFGSGLKGSEVMVYGIEGGGHTWPGGINRYSPKTVGATCRDISASEAIWDFFKRH